MKRVETSIEIAAPAERVWAVLVDVDRWGEWNPMADSLVGELRAGQQVAVHFRRGPGGRAMTIRPTITMVEPARELRWVGGLLHPTVMRGEHFFALEPTDGGCRLRHGEIFSGALIAVIGSVVAKPAMYDELNAALKARAEAPAA